MVPICSWPFLIFGSLLAVAGRIVRWPQSPSLLLVSSPSSVGRTYTYDECGVRELGEWTLTTLKILGCEKMERRERMHGRGARFGMYLETQKEEETWWNPDPDGDGKGGWEHGPRVQKRLPLNWSLAALFAFSPLSMVETGENLIWSERRGICKLPSLAMKSAVVLMLMSMFRCFPLISLEYDLDWRVWAWCLFRLL